MIVLCSGGFDPLHVGHLKYLEAAAKIGKVVVAVNSDDWLMRKKGYFLIPWEERSAIVGALGCVSDVISVNDSDGTVCGALRYLKPDIFANGGDRTESDEKEAQVCKELNIKEIFGVGGEKINSSSDIVKKVIRSHDDNN